MYLCFLSLVGIGAVWQNKINPHGTSHQCCTFLFVWVKGSNQLRAFLLRTSLVRLVSIEGIYLQEFSANRGRFYRSHQRYVLCFLSLVGIGANWQMDSIRLTLTGHHSSDVHSFCLGQGFESASCLPLLRASLVRSVTIGGI